MTTENEKSLREFEEEITFAVDNRILWMRQHLEELSEFQIGDPIFAEVAANNYKLQRAGVVAEIYLSIPSGIGRPQVCYRFERDPNYPYGSDTDSGWAFFFNEEYWKRQKQREIEKLQRELA